MTTYANDLDAFYSNYMTDEAMDAYDTERAHEWSEEDENADAYTMMEDAAMESSLWGAEARRSVT